jgi:type VI secretion system protein ImpC
MPERSPVYAEIDVRTEPESLEIGHPKPFRIAVFGDFSGRSNRGVTPDARSARPIAIDRDNFDRVLAKLAPALEIETEGAGPLLSVRFTCLDDFHPDSLFRRLPLFAKLRESRERPGGPAASPTLKTPSRQAPASSAAGNLLDRMLEESESDPPAAPLKPARPGDLQAFIDRVVAGHLVPGKDPRQDQIVARLDAAISDEMRALLHHPDFQALEAAWRALFFLAQRLDTGVDLQIHLFDLSKQELRDDLNGATDLRATAFYRHVLTNASSDPWALLIGNFSFDARPEDVELLARVAMIAHQAGAPFFAGARPAILGCDSLEGMPDPRDWHPDSGAAQFWRALRELPEASSLGLFMPRFLLRLPYGKETSPTEEFPFEEMPGVPAHNEYLWGNPAMAGACLLGQTFSEEGWDLRPGAVREIARLPLHVYERDGESVAQPCAEAWLTDRAAELILESGVIPLVSARDSDRILLVRFQSVANPPKALAARW